MRNFPQIDTTTLPRISQIDCLPQNVDPVKFEQERRAQKIEEHKKEAMSQASALKGPHYGRHRRTNYGPGNLPPISQVSMGGRQLPSDTVPEERLKLPPISQVSCLGGFVDEKNLLMKPIKSRIRESDSNYVKHAKAGGQRDLLCFKGTPERAREAAETDANVLPRSTRYYPGFTSEADPRWRPSHWSDFTRQRQERHGDQRMIWR